MKMKDHAIYEIASGDRRFRVGLFSRSDDSCKLTPEEIEVEEVVQEGFCVPQCSGKVGRTIDLFKAAEDILAKHYGDAKMIEANYSWDPIA